MCLVTCPLSVVQVSYAMQRCTGYHTNRQLNQMRHRAYGIFPCTSDSMWPTSNARPTERRSSRSRGNQRHTFFTEEVKAIYFGASNGAQMFSEEATILTDSQLLGMCTLLHHLLLQSALRPVVGQEKCVHGLGTVAIRPIASGSDQPFRDPLMVGLLQPSRLVNTQVDNGRGIVYATYGVNSAPGGYHSNCSMEEESGSASSTVSFGYWNLPDAVLTSSNGVSVVVVYATRAIAPGNELLWDYSITISPPNPGTPGY